MAMALIVCRDGLTGRVDRAVPDRPAGGPMPDWVRRSTPYERTALGHVERPHPSNSPVRLAFAGPADDGSGSELTRNAVEAGARMTAGTAEE